MTTMDLRQLRYFIAILEQGSFSKAAQRLHVAQPALSHHVRQMEEDLGVELMVRGPRGVTATEAGEKLLHHARLVMRQVDAAREEVRSAASDPGGVVAIGFPGTVSQILSVPLIEAIRADYPRIRPRIAEAMSGFIVDWLRDGSIDFGIIYRAGDTRGLEARHVLSEELCLLGPPDCELGEAENGAVGFAQAARLDLVLPGPAHNLRQQLEEVAARRNVSLAVDIEIDAYTRIKALAAKGMGYSILPRVAVEDDAAAGTLSVWRIENPALTRDVYLARAKDRPMTAAAKAALEVCLQVLRDLVVSGAWTAKLDVSELS